MDIASALAVGGAIISASGVVDLVKDYAISVAKEEIKGLWNLKDDVQEISELLETIQGVVQDAEKKQLLDKHVRKWVWDLKNVAYDLEDVLCDYWVVVTAEDGDSGNGLGVILYLVRLAKDYLCWVCDIPLSCLSIIPAAPLVATRTEIAHRLRSIKRNLVEINQRKAKLSLDAGMVGEGNESDPTRRSLGPPLWQYKQRPMMGRSETKNKIKEALLSYAAASTKESCSKLFVVGIVGVGGMGKTTLAHNIFSDKDVVNAFSSRKWLYVGVKFDLKRLMNELLGENSQLVGEDDLHSATQEKFKDQSLLIVLDDAWHTNSKDWDLLQSSLSNGAKARALIVTTLNKAVARAIRHECGYLEEELTALPDTECMDIFKRWAFMGQQAEHYPDLEWLSEKVVEKLKGVPLAATMMGRFLNTHLGNRQMWVSIASDVDWPDTDEGNVVDRVVGLSYLHLPPHLKPCFAYCAMFPKGFRFVKESLIRMWIAQGYVRPFGRELMEHTGSAYFDDLCQRSFFQFQTHEFFDDHYIMHDLIHDFAQRVFTEGYRMDASDTGDGTSSKEIRHTEDGTSFEEIRHLLFCYYGTEPSEFKRLLNFKKLRALMLELNVPNIIGPLLDVPAKFKYLRLLVLDDDKLTEFPDSIRHLKNLRYLDISGTRITSLPESVCDLVNLQFLKLPRHCALPEGMNKLINLRFIEVGYYGGVPQFEGIGQLTNLQRQRITFQVQNKRGWKISELKGLNRLHGRIAVRGLEHIKFKEEAEQACLKDKVHLEELQLHWGAEEEEETELSSIQQEHAVDSQVEEEHAMNDAEREAVDMGQSPSPYLKDSLLTVRRAQLPSWMMERHRLLPSTLVTLKLDGCFTNRECLPTLGHLPSLERLTIKKADHVRKIGSEFYGGEAADIVGGRVYFPRLEWLYLGEMSVWEEWDVPAAGEMDGDGGGTGGGRHRHVLLFPSLRWLRIYSCPKLTSPSPVLRHLTNLEYIDIRGCDELASLEEEGDGCGWVLPSLQTLTIQECPKLASLTPILRRSTNLERIEIKKCAELASLEEEGDGCVWVLPSLRELSIEECPRLASLTPILRRSTNLKMIVIKKCAELAWSEEGDGCGRMLPSGLEDLLIDDNNPKLPSLSQMLPHLTALRVLRICGFRNLQCLPLSIHNLRSLGVLWIVDCPAIECLSDGGLRLPSLRELWVRRCPLLEGRYREGGPDALNIPTTTHVDILSPPLLEG